MRDPSFADDRILVFEDALSPYGVQITSLPITSEQIVEWVAASKGAK